MKKWKGFCCFALALLLSFTFVSCTTTKIEYVPMKVDLTDVTDPVLMQRPDNSQILVIENPQTLEDIVENSAAYLYGWSVWQSYADALEQTLIHIREDLKE